jgi:hypothetical protein
MKYVEALPSCVLIELFILFSRTNFECISDVHHRQFIAVFLIVI